MHGISRVLGTAFLLVAATAGAGLAQEPAEPAAVAESATDPAAADRAYVKSVLGREEVRAVARVAGADVDGALNAVDGLEGTQLERATRQASLLDRHLGQPADRIVISATTVIIVLLLILIIVLVA